MNFTRGFVTTNDNDIKSIKTQTTYTSPTWLHFRKEIQNNFLNKVQIISSHQNQCQLHRKLQQNKQHSVDIHKRSAINVLQGDIPHIKIIYVMRTEREAFPIETFMNCTHPWDPLVLNRWIHIQTILQ